MIRSESSEPSAPYEAVIVGSGFAGAVTACRLAEAGFRVCILERGRRFDPLTDFPVYPTLVDKNVPPRHGEDGRSGVNPDISRLFWRFGNGLWDFRDLGGVTVGQAAGYGGGSLIYANVHMRPPSHVFDERWPAKDPKDGKHYWERLSSYFDLAAKMLKVRPLPGEYANLPKKLQLERLATELHRARFDCECGESQACGTYLRSFAPPLAVKFDHERVGENGFCDLRGDCCLGCPKQAKSTLDLNYLKRAEARANVVVRTLAEATAIRQRTTEEGRGGRFEVVFINHLERKAEETLLAENVFLCAGAVNTTELLLRCREREELSPTGTGLGARFHPNQDTIAAVFECEEPQDLDRGPTITTSLVYDRLPPKDDPTALWRLAFTDGAFAPKVGSTVSSSSGVEAVVAAPACVISGSFEGGDAMGELILLTVQPEEQGSEAASSPGDMEEGDELSVLSVKWAKVDRKPCRRRDWFLIQDGGLPTPVEPGLGIFRSPLWMGRNGFREEPPPPRHARGPLHDKQKNDPEHAEHWRHSAASKRNAFATLPFEAWTDLISGLTRTAAGPQFHEISEYGLQLLRAPDRAGAGDDTADGDKNEAEDGVVSPCEEKEEGAAKAAHVVPNQFRSAFEALKQRMLDRVGLATEGVVERFVDHAASNAEREFMAALENVPGFDEKELKGLKLPARALRLGMQLLWGSQSGLARSIADQGTFALLPGGGRLMEAIAELIQRGLDYRLGDGHTAMLLSMGLDSAPGKIELALPSVAPGTKLQGAKSGASAIIIALEVQSGTLFHDEAEGRVAVVGEHAGFTPHETLLAGTAPIGEFQELEPLADSKPGSATGLGIRWLRFKASIPSDPKDRRPSIISTAPLTATLPDAIDTPERGVQERVLRDIASAWGGELRTNPLWTFHDRRLSVHPQGGCSMGKDETRGVSGEDGEVFGCPGLYVMDAAAFPGPVGVNPSATIAAIAEYKARLFLEKHGRDTAELDSEREEATRYVNKQRGALDPFGSSGQVYPGPDDAEPIHRSAEPIHQALGIGFKEKMSGNVAGSSGDRKIDTALRVKIDDLGAFLARHARDGIARAPIVWGSLQVEGNPCVELDPARSYMKIMVDRGIDATGREVRTLQYYLVPKGADASQNRLEGKKTVRDDEGFDAWDDTTTLFFQLYEAGTPYEGVLRQPASEFFGGQLPSFRADTDDPARQVWAIMSFGRFFFGHLVDVYFPDLGRLGELAANLGRRGHA